MRRVLHLVEHLEEGGIERLLYALAKSTPRDLAELFFFSYETEVQKGVARQMQEEGHHLFTYKKTEGFDWHLVFRLRKVIRENRISVLHTHDFGPMEYAILLKILLPSLLLVHTQHTLHLFLRERRYVWFFQFASYFFKNTVCVSDFVKRELLRHCPLVLQNLITVHNGVDTDFFVGPSYRDEVGQLRLINISRISPEKNLIFLLRTCRNLLDQGFKVHLVHAGTGSEEEETKIRRHVHALGLDQYVEFLGFQPDVRAVLAKGDVYISTSKTEGNPVAVLEAMASGKLCLCSDIEPHLELGPGVLYFNLGDDSLAKTLQRIGLEPNRFQDFGHRARDTVVDRFSLKRMVASYLEVYNLAT